jgi:hypothetical protein
LNQDQPPNEEITIISIAINAPLLVSSALEEDLFYLINKLLRYNRESLDLAESRKKILDKKDNLELVLRNGLFLYQGRLIVPDENNLRTRLIRKTYNQNFFIYFERNKTYNLLRSRYYWRDILSDVDRYVRNCYFYSRTNIFRNKISGFLKPLSIPDYAW